MDPASASTRRLSLDISPLQLRKICLCLLFALIAATLFNIGHAIDSFVPKHIAIGYEASNTGHLPNNSWTNQIPGFYSFVSALFLVLDIDPLFLLHFPVQLIPYVTVFFTLVYLLSRGKIVIAGLLTGLQLLLNSSATSRIYLWPHGLGVILFITLLICLIVLLFSDSSYKILFLMAPCSVALVYMSYNWTAIYILIATSAVLWFWVRHRLSLSGFRWGRSEASVIVGSVVATVIPLLFSPFLYNRFLPLVRSGIKEAGIYQFLFVWLNIGTTESGEITHLLVTAPDIIQHIAIVRYSIVFIGLLSISLYVLNKLRQDANLTYSDILITSYIAGIGLYLTIRAVFVGSVAIAEFYVPGVLSLAYLYSRADRPKLVTSIVILLVVLTGTVVGTQVVNNEYGRIDDDLSVVYNIDNEQEWIERYHVQNRLIRSDELTKNGLTYNHMIDQDSPSYAAISSNYRWITTEQAAALTTREDPGDSQCFVLNDNQRQLTLPGWGVMPAWEQYSEQIHSNPYVDKEYSAGGVWYLCS